MTNPKPIYVTQPALPELDQLVPHLENIWKSKVLTNNGPYHQELERRLCEYLGVEHVCLFNNGTIALITALQALDIAGEVITTPYSFVATAHAVLWNRIEPVFVDIDPLTLNIDPGQIEKAITSKTTAILPVHCYGHPCDVDAINDIATKHSLKVIYDAAHAFGVKCHCGSVLNHGDLSVLSFHATKVFNTFEGGAIVCPDKETKELVDHLKNFGFENEVSVVTQGINGKMSEFNAALGLLQLEHIDEAIVSRQTIDARYRSALSNVKGIHCAAGSGEIRANFSYFPILVEDDFKLPRDDLYNLFRANNIFCRRYFFPLISNFPMYANLPSADAENLPAANYAADRILCLPIFPGLSQEDQDRVIDVITSA